MIVKSLNMDTEDTTAFLKEKEERLGAKIRFKTYSTWYGEIGGEKREWGVFLYSDGKVFILEDFNREPSILGFKITEKKNNDYVKYERTFLVSQIVDILQVTRNSAEKSVTLERDFSKPANLFAKAVQKLVTKVVLDDGSILFFEMMSHKDFMKTVAEFQKEAGE